MSKEWKSVCLITGGLVKRNIGLQPWGYLHKVARQLGVQGHDVTVISDHASQEGGADVMPSMCEEIDGVLVRRISTVNRFRWPDKATIEQINPDVILWHLGLPSFVHQRLNGWHKAGAHGAGGRPIVGIFPGLVHNPHELSTLGLRRIRPVSRLSEMNVLGPLVPKRLAHKAVNKGSLTCFVTPTQTTAQRLLASGLSPEQVKVIAPGIDEIWGTFQQNSHDSRQAQSRATLARHASLSWPDHDQKSPPQRGNNHISSKYRERFRSWKDMGKEWSRLIQSL